MVISGNICNTNSAHGINASRSAHALRTLRNISITGNQCANNDDDGIHVDSAWFVSITANTCIDNNSSGIQVAGGSDLKDIAIVGNNCSSSDSSQNAGIDIGSAEGVNMEVTGNVVRGNTATGINLPPTVDQVDIAHNSGF